jgi:hypothetical protein
VRTHVRGLRIGAVALAVLAFVFLEQPTGAAILVIAALLLLALAIIEFLNRPEDASPAEVEGDVVTAGATAAAEPAVVPPAPREGHNDVPSR